MRVVAQLDNMDALLDASHLDKREELHHAVATGLDPGTSGLAAAGQGETIIQRSRDRDPSAHTRPTTPSDMDR